MRVEPITLCEKRFNYLPTKFLWRGIDHRVHRIERTWSAAGGRQKPPRHYFRVRCGDDQVYNIFQDVRLNAWYVEK